MAQTLLLTVPEIATRVRLSEKSIRRAIKACELVAFKVKGRWRIAESDYEAWIERGRAVPIEIEPVVLKPAAPLRGSLAALRRIEGAA